MAAAETEPAKLLLPYLQRADELQKHEPLVAYYCRLYAMERGLKIPQSGRTKTTNSILLSLMNQLEKDKKSLKLSPDDHLHLEGFALNVFAKADKEDRAGRADLNTAKTFYAASIFFEILNQFGELAPDLEQKQKYAVWKAADIRKALKERRKPVPGPPGGEKDQATPSGTADGASDLEPSHIDRSPQVDPSPPGDPSLQMDTSPFPRPQDEVEPRPYIPPPSSSYPSHYPANDYSSPPPTNGADTSAYAQPFPHQSYPQEPQHHIPQHYPSQDVPSPFTYPNFQSYPSFSESSLPATHYPSYPQGPDASYPHLPNSSAPNYPSPPQPPQHSLIDGNGTVPGAVSAPPAQAYQYDSSYQPPPEKIAEAHKAARFAVGALAFDDVFVAVDYLKKSLDLLTNPSAKH